jgi:hypothetical protein
MNNFQQAIDVGNQILVFQFTYTHIGNEGRYFVVVPDANNKILSFYMQQDKNETWKVVDKYHLIPKWLHQLEQSISKAIVENNQK